jgi:hypothetical protein
MLIIKIRLKGFYLWEFIANIYFCSWRSKWRTKWSANAKLQMKCHWESNTNVWFPFMYSQIWNCYFQHRIIMVLSPSSYTYISVRDYISLPILLQEICGPILGIYKSLTDTWMWTLGLRPRNSQKRNTLMGFSLQCTSAARCQTPRPLFWSCKCEQWEELNAQYKKT